MHKDSSPGSGIRIKITLRDAEANMTESIHISFLFRYAVHVVQTSGKNRVTKKGYIHWVLIWYLRLNVASWGLHSRYGSRFGVGSALSWWFCTLV